MTKYNFRPLTFNFMNEQFWLSFHLNKQQLNLKVDPNTDKLIVERIF